MKRGRGRPPTGRSARLDTKIQPSTLAAVDAWAETQGIGRAAAVDRLLLAALEMAQEALRHDGKGPA